MQEFEIANCAGLCSGGFPIAKRVVRDSERDRKLRRNVCGIEEVQSGDRIDEDKSHEVIVVCVEDVGILSVKSAQARQRAVEIQLLREREKILNRYLSSLMKNMAGVTVGNASLWWSLVYVDDKVAVLEPDMCLEIKAVAEPAQPNKKQVAQLVKASFSEDWKKLMEQAH